MTSQNRLRSFDMIETIHSASLMHLKKALSIR